MHWSIFLDLWLKPSGGHMLMASSHTGWEGPWKGAVGWTGQSWARSEIFNHCAVAHQRATGCAAGFWGGQWGDLSPQPAAWRTLAMVKKNLVVSLDYFSAVSVPGDEKLSKSLC